MKRSRVSCVSSSLEGSSAHSISVLSQLDDQFSAIDFLPESLFSAVVTHPAGNLEPRCEAIAALRSCLLQGKVSQLPCLWLPDPVQHQLVASIESLGVERFCRNNEEVTDALILDLLRALENHQRLMPFLVQRIVNERQEEELVKFEQSLDKGVSGTRKNSNSFESLSDALKERLREEAELEGWMQMFRASKGVEAIWSEVWSERLAVWQELETVFSDLGLVTGLGFDLSFGILQSHGWLNLVRLHKIVKKLPQLREVIQTLGRMKVADGVPVIEEIMERMSIVVRDEKEVVTPFVPMETKGITRSDSITRMLPQEAALLGHPVLKKLWHARRAEHALLSYAVEGTEIFVEEREEESEVPKNQAGTKRNKNRGPMIVCLDTSGSMQGTPENVAKALVLECLSVATKEKRACYVYLFGSSGEIEELELTPTESGLERMITFLSMSFGGGTDAEGPLKLALERAAEEKWRDADVLLVSDGEFSLKASLTRRINEQKANDALKVHGVLIGNNQGAMARVCDPLHRFSQWLDLQVNRWPTE